MLSHGRAQVRLGLRAGKEEEEDKEEEEEEEEGCCFS